MSKKRISPLVTIILGAVILSVGLGLATWYWMSQTLTYTMTVEGNIVATTNFINADLVGITTYAELEAACVDEMFPFGDHFIVRVASGGGNPTTVYTSLEVALPGSSTCTATLAVAPFTNGVPGTGSSLGSIATDGSESVQVIMSGNPTWLLESNYASGVVNVLYFEIYITWDSSLSIGSHDVTAVVRLGDSS